MTENVSFCFTVCTVYDKMVSGGIPPHVVMDFTWTGISSDVMKALTRNLGLPTISGSMGGVGDIRYHSYAKCQLSIYIRFLYWPNQILEQH